MINKQSLRQQLLQILHDQRANALTAADSAHDAATHEQSVAETQYDTVGLEAAYLAHGQSQRVMECDVMIQRLSALALRDFTDNDEIGYGALVTLSNNQVYWLLPVCGGARLKYASVSEQTITVVTDQSPLGQMLEGAEIAEVLANGHTIIAIC
ncbi:hypothetical protein [Vibrio palustris]|uniref:Transcription elongation factor n=1 Tax=Vibrio palustris TaxID=1918946 RepID=A0A1R4B4T5_9VIBR|nr:hypothetical protein [Vibrio palustris]SJL83913.1 hypothetical protein VPAL9027_01892 [Vibrio palustris]